MIKLKRFVPLVAGLLTFSVIAKTPPENIAEINVPMTEIGHLLESTLPIIYDDEAFSDPKNKDIILEKLEKLQALFKHAEPHLKQKSVVYKISSDVFFDQLDSARLAFSHDEPKLAQHILKGIPGVCSSCHLNDTHKNTLFHELKLENFNSDFDKAEFSFVTRDYDNALKYYKKWLAQPVHDEVKQLKALERLLVIYSEVYQEPKTIYQQLKKYRLKHKLPNSVRISLDAWLKGLEEYIDQSGIVDNGVDYSKLDDYMNRHYTKIEAQLVPNIVEEKDKIFYVMLRGSLHAYLNNKPAEEEIPALLYWLAICDKTLEYNFYYSFADWYLKECIKGYPSNPFAQKCYQAYDDYLTFAYTGSRGTDLPPNIQKELSQLRDLLKKNQKS